MIRQFITDHMLSVVYKLFYLQVITDEQKIGTKTRSSVYHTRIMLQIRRQICMNIQYFSDVN